MSFYGSVYYQLVDTFYKIIAKNNGRDNNNFLFELEKEMPNQAVGRKGVIELDTGNRWINIADTKAQDSASYQIWHGAPDLTTVKPDNGFKVLLTDKEIKNRIQNGVIYLQDADQFETYENTYDNAGHIASSVKKIYRLPKAEVVEEVEELQALVGVPDGKELPDISDKTLYGYTTENYKDITQLEKYVGDWNQTIKHDPNRFSGTIAAVIGNINTMLGVSGNISATSFKSLTDVIGKIKDLDEKDLYATSSDKPLNIIDGLVKLQKSFKNISATVGTNKTISDGQFASILSRLGVSINEDSIYDHIKAIYGDDDGEVTDSLTTLAARTKALEDKDDSLDLDIKDIVDKMNWSDERTIAKAISDIEKILSWTSENTVAKEIADIQTDLGWNRDDSVALAMTDIEGRATNLETHATNSEDAIKTLQDRAKTIEEAATELTKRVNFHYESQNTENNNLHKADSDLDERIDGVVKAIGTLPTDKTVVTVITETAKSINDTIGTVPEESNVMKELVDSTNNLQGQINILTANLGTVTEGTNAYSLINKNIKDISDINTVIGFINDGNTISGLINANTGLIAQQGNSILTIQQNYMTKNEAEQDYLKIEDAEGAYLATEVASQTYLTIDGAKDAYVPIEILGDIGSWENPDNTIASKINSLEGVINEVNNVIGDISEVEEKTLIELLLEMKAEIAEIKTVINTLHPDDEPPFPDMNTPELPPEKEPIPDPEEPGEPENDEIVNPEDELENESSRDEGEPNE